MSEYSTGRSGTWRNSLHVIPHVTGLMRTIRRFPAWQGSRACAMLVV
ncbi:hypothetical protein ACFY36_36010 [Actinoplanes sp. NPDC000266]